ncbi:hypothetical protein E2R56_27960 [Rhodococcus qingshengii]|nr:hypothetical protein E2R56_27960 [Rhodococcus qingshengii]
MLFNKKHRSNDQTQRNNNKRRNYGLLFHRFSLLVCFEAKYFQPFYQYYNIFMCYFSTFSCKL